MLVHIERSRHLCCACLRTECVSNVDETLGEMFLEEKTLTEDDIRVGCSQELSLQLHTSESDTLQIYVDFCLVLSILYHCFEVIGSLYLSVTPKFYTEVLHQTTDLTPN